MVAGLVVAGAPSGDGDAHVSAVSSGQHAPLGHQGSEHVDADRVEVAAPSGQEMGQRGVGVPGPPVGPVRGQGVPHVGHGGDARRQGDVLPGQAVGVPGAVEPLVVVPAMALDRW